MVLALGLTVGGRGACRVLFVILYIVDTLSLFLRVSTCSKEKFCVGHMHFIARFWTFSSSFVSVIWCGSHTTLAYSRRGRTRVLKHMGRDWAAL